MRQWEVTEPRKLMIQFLAIKLSVYSFETSYSFRGPKGNYLKVD